MNMERIKNSRYFGVLFLIPILLAFVVGGLFLKLITAFMSFRALYEFYSVVKNKGIKPNEKIGYLGTAILYIYMFLFTPNLKIIALAIIFTVTLTLFYTVFSELHSIVDAAITIVGFIYACLYFALVLLIYEMPKGNIYILTIFTIAWACDTLAYYVGRYYKKFTGKTLGKLIPLVSPNKSIEGAIGGLFGGSIITMIYGIIFRNYGVMAWYHFLLMGLFGSILSQVGDLIASSIKRDCNVKDYPKLIPGHGGILDRFDSVLMSIVAVFLYLTIILGH